MLTRSFLFVLPILLLSQVAPAVTCGEEGQFASGTGIETDPYQIATAQQLQNLNNCLGKDYMDNYYELTEDIELEEYLAEGGAGYEQWGEEGWLPIGSDDEEGTYFSGNFNGNWHKVTGLWINRPRRFYVGLFGSICRDFTIEKIGIHINNDRGGIVGYGTVGGLAGSLDTKFEAQIGEVSNVYVLGNVYGKNEHIGGLAGVLMYVAVSDSYADGDIQGGRITGGLAGSIAGTVSNSYAAGSVTGEQTLGGLIGLVNGPNAVVSNSYATSDVSSAGNVVGGLAGENTGTIENCYATGIVTGSLPTGGLVGLNGGTVGMSYFAGTLIGNSLGGLIGENDANSLGYGGRPPGLVNNSFYDQDKSGQNDTEKGTPKSTADMKLQATYDSEGENKGDWDFESVWIMDDGTLNEG
jgi:hypothetical protein